jgi:hypothetical protein
MQSEQYDLSPEEINRGNKLIASFGELLENERNRYLQQASQLLEIGSLEIFRSNCKFSYDLGNDNITFQVNRLANNTSYAGELPLPQSSQEVIERIITVFAQSEAASRI